jgi:hypothetical protein
MTTPTLEQSRALVAAVRSAMLLSQKGIAELCGYERRTAMKWAQGRTRPGASDWIKMARAVYPRDRSLAATLAATADQTLVSLGLEAPPAPAPPPVLPPKPAPSHLADSIVCAAAEAMQTTPQAMRPGLVAAFERTVALGMSAAEVLEAWKQVKRAKG